MEKNKLLIGAQFTGQDRSIHLELYVGRDMLLIHLLDGIQRGLEKLAGQPADTQGVYSYCQDIYNKCRHEKDGNNVFKRITLTSFDAEALGKAFKEDKRLAFTENDLQKPLCELGFITSTRIIFDATDKLRVQGSLDTTDVVSAFNPKSKPKIVFPEYNISTRQLYKFKEEPVELIAPTDPPKKPDTSLFQLLMPSIITMGIMIIIRMFMSGMDTGMGMSMILLSIGGSITAGIMTARQHKKQKADYEKNLNDWRSRYQEYISATIADIKARQKKDTQMLETLYPDMLNLIKKDQKNTKSIYAASENIYSRVPQDVDFLTFRIGWSDKVPSFFEVKGDKKDVVYSEAFFKFKKTNLGEDTIDLLLREEVTEEIEKEKKKKKKGEEEETIKNLCNLPYEISRRYKHLKKAPLLYSLKNKSCLGIIDRSVPSLTDYTNANQLSKSYYFISRMIFELCYYHSPDDLQFVVFFKDEKDWEKIEGAITMYKFLPHFRGLFADKSQFVFDKEGAQSVLSSLLSIVNAREQEGAEAKTPHIVMIVFDDHNLKEHAFAEYLPKAPEDGAPARNNLGLSFVFAAKYKEYLPSYCDDIVDFSEHKMTLTPRNDIQGIQSFSGDRDSAKNLAQFDNEYSRNLNFALRFLASMSYARIAQNENVPNAVNFFETMEVRERTLVETICTNWGVNGGERPIPPVTKSLRVPIGKTESGLAYLDLHEKKDGPHMLVAGMTGSGKTEAILSYLLGLCMQYRPDEVNLLLVDMKGGGFTKRIGDLPHVVGLVTDVEGDENGTGAEYMLNRFLFAIKSEIKRRKLLLNRLHVDSLDGYIEACKDIEKHIRLKNLADDEADRVRETAEKSPLTHLILVVDEFTELKRFSSENSDIDFISEITTIARVGRSLGLHIILISQNIEGAITDDIRANTNARYCLKVATKQASKEMIGTELAASAYMPNIGRAYLQVSSGDKLTYFQSAYSKTGTEEKVPVEITLACKTGENICFYRSNEDANKGKKDQHQGSDIEKSQQQVICEELIKISANKNIVAPQQVFSKPLAQKIAWDREASAVYDLDKKKRTRIEGGEKGDSKIRKLAVGQCDDPLHQRQQIARLDPYRSHIAVFGAPMSGKTTFLKTLLVRLHEDMKQIPREDIYVLDFGGNIGAYGKLGNVCACFNNSNEENIKRVFKTIEQRLEKNTKRLDSQNYYNVVSKKPKEAPNHMFLIIDNINAFVADERYATYQDMLIRFCRDGLTKGLTIVITANETTGLSRLLPNFGQKIAFEIPSDSYFDVFGTKVTQPMRIPGRGVINDGADTYEFQSFLPFLDLDEEKHIQDLVKKTASVANDHKMEIFPDVLTKEACKDAINRLGENEVIVGLDYYEHRPIAVDIEKQRTIAIYGKRNFGKTNLLKLLLEGIKEKRPDALFYYFDDGRNQLEVFHDPEQYPEYYISNKMIATRDDEELYKHLKQNGYIVVDDEDTEEDSAVDEEKPRDTAEREFTVFVLQSKMLYRTGINNKSNTCLNRLLACDAEAMNFLLIFSDVPNITDYETQQGFKDSIAAAFLLDNIGEFINNRSDRTAFGAMDARELREAFAKCSIGDGYYYDVEADKLEKLKFIKSFEKRQKDDEK